MFAKKHYLSLDTSYNHDPIMRYGLGWPHQCGLASIAYTAEQHDDKMDSLEAYEVCYSLIVVSY